MAEKTEVLRNPLKDRPAPERPPEVHLNDEQTKAADALGYSQSAVSQMIQSLEAELELTLLHRGHRSVIDR